MANCYKLVIWISSEWIFKPPNVRIWIDDYLIAERIIRPNKNDGYVVKEVVTLELSPGEYTLVVENVSHQVAKIKVTSIEVDNKIFAYTSKDDNTYIGTLTI